MKKRITVVLLCVGLAASAIAVALIPKHRTRSHRNQCVNNLRMLDAAAMSHCLAENLPFDRLLSDTDIAELSQYLKGGVPPVCPSGSLPYPPFDVLHGPRCPNSEEHSQVFVTDSCRGERSAVWAAALSYAAARGLLWSDTVHPKDFSIAFYCGKCTGTCPLGTNGYPPFVLSEGPKCPYSKEHSQPVRLWRNMDFFDNNGRPLTNRSLSDVDTNNWTVWIQAEMKKNNPTSR